MTFNVEKFTDHSVGEVLRAIGEANPDVVCLQEAAKLPPPFRVPAELRIPGYRTVSDGEIAILSRLPVLRHESIPLGAGPESRPLLVVHVSFQGHDVAVASVHYQFFPWDDASISAMQETAAIRDVQRRTLGDFARVYGEDLVLCGDFNSVPNAPVIRTLDRYLTDSFAATSRGFGWTVPSGFPLRRLDYVFVGRGLRPISSRVLGRVVSDHRAVVVEVGF